MLKMTWDFTMTIKLVKCPSICFTICESKQVRITCTSVFVACKVMQSLQLIILLELDLDP